MEDGKSQTWIAYASSLADEYNIDYIVKQDSDSMLILDKFFEFIDGSLPASPYNHHTFASIMLMCQPNHNKDCSGYKKKFEGPSSMVRKFGNFHVYGQGQFYLMSSDVARTVKETAKRQQRITKQYGENWGTLKTLMFLPWYFNTRNHCGWFS